MTRDKMKSCYYCQHEETVFDGRTGRTRCLLGHRLKICGDYTINPVWESRRGEDGQLLPIDRWKREV